MMQVVRIEHPDDGFGFFHSSKPIYLTANLWSLYHRHFAGTKSSGFNFPTPANDGVDIHQDGQRWFCAFKNIQQLQSLIFPEELQILLRMGYNVLLLTVIDYQVGEHQVVFRKESIIQCDNINSIFIS